MIIFSLGFTFSLAWRPGLVLLSFIRLRLEITSFHSPQASGGARHVGFIVHGSRWGWSGQVFTGIHGLGLRQF